MNNEYNICSCRAWVSCGQNSESDREIWRSYIIINSTKQVPYNQTCLSGSNKLDRYCPSSRRWILHWASDSLESRRRLRVSSYFHSNIEYSDIRPAVRTSRLACRFRTMASGKKRSNFRNLKRIAVVFHCRRIWE